MRTRGELEAKRRFWGVAVAADVFFIAFCALALSARISSRLHASAPSPLGGGEGEGSAAPLAQTEKSGAPAASPPAPAPQPPSTAAPAAPSRALAAAPQAPSSKNPAASAPAKAQPIEFHFSEGRPKNVALAGSFNKWKPKRMSKKAGEWKAKTYLLPGTYRYHFVVDGKPRLDPRNPLKEGESSVLVVPAEAALPR